MLGYLQLDRIHVIFVNEADYRRDVHRCHITSVQQTNQYLKDKREFFTLQFSPCQFRSRIPSVMPGKSSIRVLSGADDAFHKRRNCSHQCGCTIRNGFMYAHSVSHSFSNGQHAQIKFCSFTTPIPPSAQKLLYLKHFEMFLEECPVT
ncbi:uncharacterized protein LOC143431602 [Xylocopa sonorina]|uniref:uncharacterized protein LOC143431602 n=1 Tax=Xylocopa sonorina TaxID=1818115 RepID=UPI00403A8227